MTIEFGATAGADGYKNDLPLDRDLDGPIVVDISALRECHPMFALRLRVFIDWHREAGHEVRVVRPVDKETAQRLADLDVARDLPPDVLDLPAPSPDRHEAVLPLVRFTDHTMVEETALAAVELLHRQVLPLGPWGDAIHMAIGELCDNALQHGRNDFGAFVAADRTLLPSKMVRLVIADLGIGIPEHVRNQHPEWQDDTAAIARALTRGVSGTGDPHRGNGFSEVFDAATRTDLVRAASGADVDIRASKGRMGVRVVGGNEVPEPRALDQPRRGTWITYTVQTA